MTKVLITHDRRVRAAYVYLKGRRGIDPENLITETEHVSGSLAFGVNLDWSGDTLVGIELLDAAEIEIEDITEGKHEPSARAE
jgi:hypothetical protein